MITRFVDLTQFQPSGDEKADMKALANLIQKQFDYYNQMLTRGASGTFYSADNPNKVVTVTGGTIKEIK